MSAVAATRFTVTGVVQGVGFRPFVYRLAGELGLRGLVGNDAGAVFIEAAGTPAALAEFERRLCGEAPPLARVHEVRTSPMPRAPDGDTFVIVDSRPGAGGRTLVSPDIAVCEDCVAELFDPADRRYLHPFITCTNCGPRYTITTALPYDRATTTLAAFPLCPDCAAEYHDPHDRRFHAQPIGCHRCGPRLWWRDVPHHADAAAGGADPATSSTPLAAARRTLERGLVVAIKGLGGYHLACDATDTAAVALPRRRKRRPEQPFAVMVADVAAAEELARLSPAERDLLCSPARPIVLVARRADAPLAAQVAPDHPLIGLMLPYTPVHHLLFAADRRPLVMTSGNRSGAPIVYRDADVEAVLGEVVDGVLGHDRPIHVPCDDSVVRIIDGRVAALRRARGYAPLPVAFPHARRDVLAVGGELKNTFCVVHAGQAWMSQHLGDMGDLDTLDAFEASVRQLQAFYDVRPAVVVADRHPRYLTTGWARQHHPGSCTTVQHHHAHVAAVMAEHGLDPHRAVIGVAYDGTGYGDDATVWGGEIVRADVERCERVAHLAPIALPGGDAAVLNPCRVALAHLHAAGLAWRDDLAPVRACETTERRLLARQLERGVACVATTSMGRLFDAVSSLVGLRHRISYEAQGAIELEMAATAWTGHTDRYRFAVDDGVLDPAPVLHAIVEELRRGEPVAAIAAAFHEAVARATADAVASAGTSTGTVVLSGGVFQNALLTTRTRHRLEMAGFTVHTNHIVPANDGGLALGQAFIAAHRTQEER